MKFFNYVLILIGAVIAIYAKTGTEQNEYVLIGGIAVLMIGIYRISKSIPSKYDDDENTSNIKKEE
jgi:hypothetical membrane protein